MKNKEFFYNRLVLPQLVILIVFLFLLLIVEFFYINRSLDTKKYLVTDKAKIFFAGDSRAQRGLDPSVLVDNLNMKDGEVVNIAVDSGDPTMLIDLINDYPSQFKNSIIFLSISANQINDGANDIGRFTNSMISKLSFFDKITIFNDKEILINFYLNGIKNLVPKLGNDFVETMGFQSVNTIYSGYQTETQLNFNKHPWFVNWNGMGFKYNILLDTLKKIKSRVKTLYVFSAPYAPSYLKNLSEESIYKLKKFSSCMDKLSVEANVTYLDLTFESLNLNDNDFTDNTHLNQYGAKKFTEYMSRRYLNE